MTNLVKAVLILNAKKGWSEAARRKAAMTRKRKAAVETKSVKSKKPAKSKSVSLDGGTAMKTRSALEKHFKLKKSPAYPGSSNPYSPTQRLGGSVGTQGHKDLMKHLAHPDNGWKSDNTGLLPGHHGFTKGEVRLVVTEKPDLYGRERRHTVSIFGPKKAKPYSLPYYD